MSLPSPPPPPSYYFTQIQEAKQCPGTIAINIDLMLALLENVCDEIARNGLQKIILLNGHGGNETWLSLFAMKMLERQRAFTLYIIRLQDYYSPVVSSPEFKAMMASKLDNHGGEAETSALLAVRPDLVRMEDIGAPEEGQRRLAHLPGLLTPIWWYADAPRHYYGDATAATAEKGEWLMEHFVASVAGIIKAVKADERTRALEDEYFSQVQH